MLDTFLKAVNSYYKYDVVFIVKINEKMQYVVMIDSGGIVIATGIADYFNEAVKQCCNEWLKVINVKGIIQLYKELDNA